MQSAARAALRSGVLRNGSRARSVNAGRGFENRSQCLRALYNPYNGASFKVAPLSSHARWSGMRSFSNEANTEEPKEEFPAQFHEYLKLEDGPSDLSEEDMAKFERFKALQAAADGEEASEEEEPAAVKERLDGRIGELEAEVADLKDKVLRSYAEMENVRSRTKRDVSSAQTYANQKFAKSLLIVADNLQRALDSVPAEVLETAAEAESGSEHTLKILHEGISIVDKDLTKIFVANGVEAFGEAGDTFDPQLHEAFLQMPSTDFPPGSVAMVMQRGYKYKDRVIRPAQVGTVKTE